MERGRRENRAATKGGAPAAVPGAWEALKGRLPLGSSEQLGDGQKSSKALGARTLSTRTAQFARGPRHDAGRVTTTSIGRTPTGRFSSDLWSIWTGVGLARTVIEHLAPKLVPGPARPAGSDSASPARTLPQHCGHPLVLREGHGQLRQARRAQTLDERFHSLARFAPAVGLFQRVGFQWRTCALHVFIAGH